jgi:DNA-binding Xre family transcriptional regulator
MVGYSRGDSLAKSEFLLNHIFLKNRIAELGVKQWWLAEQIGVDRKTVIRWVQGQVKSIQIENAEKLIKILDCRMDELKSTNESKQFATAEDQKAAAALLVTSSLIGKLGPIGEWNVIESLLKSTMVPNLPLNILGELFDQLTIASCRQSKIDQASTYNFKTEEIAMKSGDKALLASALLSKANIQAWRGKITQAIGSYRDCMALGKYLEPGTLAAVYSNWGAVLYESGDLVGGKNAIQMSLPIFKTHHKPTSLSIAYAHLAMIALQEAQNEVALEQVSTSIQYAVVEDYRRGMHMGKLIQAEIAARLGDTAMAQTLVTSALSEFEKMGIHEGLNFEYAGRTHRLIGELDSAEAYLRQGLKAALDFPVCLAALHMELAEVLRLKQSKNWPNEIQSALAIYQSTECPIRAAQAKKRLDSIS